MAKATTSPIMARWIPEFLQATRTNWQDIKHPIDSEKLDWVRSEHKRSVYVKEMREEWFNNQRKQDQKALLLRELDRLSELL